MPDCTHALLLYACLQLPTSRHKSALQASHSYTRLKAPLTCHSTTEHPNNLERCINTLTTMHFKPDLQLQVAVFTYQGRPVETTCQGYSKHSTNTESDPYQICKYGSISQYLGQQTALQDYYYGNLTGKWQMIPSKSRYTPGLPEHVMLSLLTASSTNSRSS